MMELFYKIRSLLTITIERLSISSSAGIGLPVESKADLLFNFADCGNYNKPSPLLSTTVADADMARMRDGKVKPSTQWHPSGAMRIRDWNPAGQRPLYSDKPFSSAIFFYLCPKDHVERCSNEEAKN